MTMRSDPADLPQHEPAFYAQLRAAGIDAGSAFALTTTIFPLTTPAADPRALQRQRQREHLAQPTVRRYVGD